MRFFLYCFLLAFCVNCAKAQELSKLEEFFPTFSANIPLNNDVDLSSSSFPQSRLRERSKLIENTLWSIAQDMGNPQEFCHFLSRADSGFQSDMKQALIDGFRNTTAPMVDRLPVFTEDQWLSLVSVNYNLVQRLNFAALEWSQGLSSIKATSICGYSSGRTNEQAYANAFVHMLPREEAQSFRTHYISINNRISGTHSQGCKDQLNVRTSVLREISSTIGDLPNSFFMHADAFMAIPEFSQDTMRNFKDAFANIRNLTLVCSVFTIENMDEFSGMDLQIEDSLLFALVGGGNGPSTIGSLDISNSSFISDGESEFEMSKINASQVTLTDVSFDSNVSSTTYYRDGEGPARSQKAVSLNISDFNIDGRLALKGSFGGASINLNRVSFDRLVVGPNEDQYDRVRAKLGNIIISSSLGTDISISEADIELAWIVNTQLSGALTAEDSTTQSLFFRDSSIDKVSLIKFQATGEAGENFARAGVSAIHSKIGTFIASGIKARKLHLRQTHSDNVYFTLFYGGSANEFDEFFLEDTISGSVSLGEASVSNIVLTGNKIANSLNLDVTVSSFLEVSNNSLGNALVLGGEYDYSQWEPDARGVIAGNIIPILFVDSEALFLSDGEYAPIYLKNNELEHVATFFTERDTTIRRSILDLPAEQLIGWAERTAEVFRSNDQNLASDTKKQLALLLNNQGYPQKAKELSISAVKDQLKSGGLTGYLLYILGYPISWGFENEWLLGYSLALIFTGSFLHWSGTGKNSRVESVFFSLDRAFVPLFLNRDWDDYSNLNVNSRWYFYFHRAAGLIILTYGAVSLTDIFS